MNNIQKAFKNKAKCGLRMAAGGIIDSSLVDQQAIKAGTVDPNGSDFDTINAERTLRWANDDAATAKKYHTAFEPTMAATDLAKGLLSQPQPAQTTQGVQPVQPAAPMDTTFAQDMNARDQRIRGYGKGLGRNYADGGVIQETPDQLMARMAAKYGVGGGKPAPVQAPVAAPQPVQQPVVQPPPAPLGLRGIATGGLDRRMAAAGMAEGGIVHGKGGPTDDAVPMNVGGVDVNLSNKEAVLPAKSVAALGGPEAVEELIEHTNGKPPVKSGLRAGGEYADGASGWGFGKSSAFNDDAGLDVAAKTLRAQPVQAPATAPAEPGIIVINGIRHIDTKPTAEAPKLSDNRPSDPDTDGRRQYSTPTAPAFTPNGSGMPVPPEAPKGVVVPLGQPAAVAAPAPDAKVRKSLSAGLAVSGMDTTTAGVVADAAQSSRDKRADFGTTMDASKFAPADGAGVITRAPGANGLRRATLVAGPSDSDAARDAAFAKAGTKKDAYGNWMSDQRNGDKAALAQIQQERTLRDAFSPDITDPNVQSNARARLGYDLAGQQVAAKGGLEQARLMLEAARFNREGEQQKLAQKNADRSFNAADEEKHQGRVDDLVKSWATGPDGKLDNQKYTALQKYAGQFDRGVGPDGTKQKSAAHLRDLEDNFAVDNLFNDQGRHLLTPEAPDAGEAVVPKVEDAGWFSALAHGRMGGQNAYRDPATNRLIYQSDIERTLSPNQKAILQARLAAAKKGQ